MASLELEGVRVVYPGGHLALPGLDLRVDDGERLVLVGPSGCGKSTVLRVVAGLERPEAGRVRIDGRDVTDVSPRERDVAMVFQSYALYPHKSVAENLAFGLRMRGAPRAEIEARVARTAARLGLSEVLRRRPAQLSGGQRQRVALGRAIAREPAVFLLDEPLSNLDAKLRAETRAEIARLHRELGTTLLYVTHDQEEAMTLGDRVAVLREGALEQLDAPLAIYRRPASRFVADFIGTPRMNWFAGHLEAGPGGRRLTTPDFSVALPDGPGAGEVAVGVRPQELVPGRGELSGRVEVVEPLGASILVHARSPAGTAFRLLLPADAAVEVDAALEARVEATRLHLFDAASGSRLA